MIFQYFTLMQLVIIFFAFFTVSRVINMYLRQQETKILSYITELIMPLYKAS